MTWEGSPGHWLIIVRDLIPADDLDGAYAETLPEPVRGTFYHRLRLPDPKSDRTGYRLGRWWRPDRLVGQQWAKEFLQAGISDPWPRP